jgi:carboxyl-terminal processing protease
MNQKKLIIWLPLLLATAVFLGMLFGYKLKSNMGQYSPSFFGKEKKTSLQEILELVKTRYVDTVNTDSLGQMAIKNVINQLDPHSVYIPVDQLKTVNDDMKGSFEGVGIEFGLINDTVTVLKLFPKGPAEKAGILPADQILSANDSIVSGVRSSEDRIRTLFRGEKGTEVKVQLLRKGTGQTLMLQRGVIPVSPIDVAYLIEPGIGYIRINKFSNESYVEFMKNMERLKKDGMVKLVLDLRDNGGGMLSDAIEMADEFLSDTKEIVYTEGKASARQVFSARRPGLFEEGKLVVLVDEGSASASEVLTGALQDWDRATIVGRRTFGKGLVQEQFQLSDGSALRLTISRYFTPIGRSIQKPYLRGETESYNKEIINRYSEGAMFQNDSANHTGRTFKTKGGRKVYGGGGISPDVFVAADSSEYLMFHDHNMVKKVIDETAFLYYNQFGKELIGIKTPLELQSLIQSSEILWKIFNDRSKIYEKDKQPFSSSQKNILSRYLGARIGHFLWEKDAYYKMLNLSDTMLIKALEEIKK